MLGPISRFDRTGSIITYIQTKDYPDWKMQSKLLWLFYFTQLLLFPYENWN